MLSGSSLLLVGALTGLALAQDPALGPSYPLPLTKYSFRNIRTADYVNTLAPGTNTSTSIMALYEHILSKGNAPAGALLLTKANGEELRVSFGKQSLQEGAEPFKLDSKWRIGSVTKTFTGSAILKLVQEGKLSLDDTWNKFYDPSLGEFPYADTITIRQMLSQTSGIPEYIFAKQGGYDAEIKSAPFNWTYEDTVRLILDRTPYFPPGETTSFNYTNSNFVLLGQRVIEQVTQMPWRDYFTKEIIAPAGLTQTSVPAVGEFDVPEPSARLYAYRALNVTVPGASDMANLIDYTHIDPSAWGSAGSFVSDLNDMHTWAKIVATGEGLDDALKTERFEANLHPFPKTLPPGLEFSYGLGLMKINGYYGHIGDVVGASTYMFHNPTNGNTAVWVATNGPSAIAIGDAALLLSWFDPEAFSA